MSNDGLFDGVLPFVRVAEHLSFRRAAEAMGVTAAATSRAVQRLEDDLGVKLFERTTRTVRLTEEGARFLERCREAVAQVRAARDEMTEARRVPQGTLAVSASPILARLLVTRLADFLASYPALRVRLGFTDRFVRMPGDDVDVALRVGPGDDDGVVARPLLTTRWVTVASPAYVARHGAPERPEDLAGHACLRFLPPRGPARDWTYAERRGPLPVQGPLEADLGEVLLDAALAGVGVCQVLDFMAAPALADGRLVELLAGAGVPGPTVFAVYAPSRRALPRVRVFVDFLATSLQSAMPSM
jgi:DNA-binding transcriptional LysR family regulator